MGQKTITVSVSDTVDDEAAKQGLLKPEAIEALLREKLRLSGVDRLFEAADKLAALDLPPLTESEIDAEIQAARRS